MILFLYDYFSLSFSWLNILRYTSFRSFLAAGLSFSLSLWVGRPFIAFLTQLKAKQIIREEGPASHHKKVGVPTMGGLMMISTLLISSLLTVSWSSPYLWILLLGSLGFGLIGFLDDYLKISRKNTDGLKAGYKMLGLLIVGGGLSSIIYFLNPVASSLIYVPFLKTPLMSLGIFYIFFGILLLSSSTNAVNLTDGLDGLASGLSLMVVLTFSIIAYLTGRIDFATYLNIPYVQDAQEITVFASALMGSIAGFLWYNAHPSQVFMGDVGSLFLGGVLGLMAMLLKKEILFVFLGGVFVVETLSVIIQVAVYKRTKKRIFRMAPLHHHFELLGWTENKVVVRFWIIGAFLAILSLASLKVQ